MKSTSDINVVTGQILKEFNKILLMLNKFVKLELHILFIKSLEKIEEVKSFLEDNQYSQVISYVKIRDNMKPIIETIDKDNTKIDKNIFFNPRYYYFTRKDKEKDTDVFYKNTSLSLFYNGDLEKKINSKNYNSENEYDHLLHYGNFNKIFVNTQNKHFGKNMEEVTKKILNGENVFIIGYGASGAGKTSTLIYDKINKSDGAIVFMLKGIENSIQTVTVSIKELYLDNDLKPQEFLKLSQLEFQKKDNDFTADLDKAISQNRVQFPFSVPDEKIKDKKKERSKEINLSNILKLFIDEFRMVKATTNNPQSSRSHIMVKMEIKMKGDRKATIYIGDFAGVENKFDYELDLKALQ